MNTTINVIQKTGHSGQNWSVTSLRGVTAGTIRSYETGQSHRERHTPKKLKGQS